MSTIRLALRVIMESSRTPQVEVWALQDTGTPQRQVRRPAAATKE